jgi:Cu/Ag efflux protein CusF
MKSTWMVVAGAGLAAALGGCASEKAAKATPPAPTVATERVEGKDSVTESELVTMTVTVVNVDYDDRIVTVRGPQGKVVDLKVSDEVRNLPQVKKGDQIVAKYYQSVAVEVMKPGAAKPGMESVDTAGRAPLGARPAAAAASTDTIVATIQKIDRATQMVTLKGPKGHTVEVHVKDPTRLEGVKKGDRVQITYTRALAIAVEPVGKKH